MLAYLYSLSIALNSKYRSLSSTMVLSGLQLPRPVLSPTRGLAPGQEYRFASLSYFAELVPILTSQSKTCSRISQDPWVMRTGLAIDYGLTWKFIGQADFALQATQINVYILPSSPGDSLRSSSWRLKGADMSCSPRGFFQEQSVPWGPVVSGSSWNALSIFSRSQSKALLLASKQMWAMSVL